MKFFYLGVYTLFLVMVWGFFIVAKLHAYKFKNFSTNIPPITNTLLVFLIVLSFSGYFIILSSSLTPSRSASVFDTKNNTQINTIDVTNKAKFDELDFNEINY